MAQPRERRRMPDDPPEISIDGFGRSWHRPWKEEFTEVATVSILGADRHPAPRTRDRSPLLMEIIEGLICQAAAWRLDAILFPGGFFRIGQVLGDQDTDGRIIRLLHTRAARAARKASHRLDAVWPWVTLVLGIDSNPMTGWRGGDQLVTAWQAGKLIGLARKAFPVWTETGDAYEPVVWVKPGDADDPLRLVTLRNGNRAILCACYDAFALRAAADPRFADLGSIRLMLDDQGIYRRPTMLERHEHLRRWTAFLKAHPPDLALVAIHHFARPGRDCYWQRHGIAGASAGLSGAPILGAAHFREWLPSTVQDCPLASQAVPPEHLAQGHHRKAHRLLPDDGFHLVDANGVPIALIRRFTLDHRLTQERDIP